MSIRRDSCRSVEAAHVLDALAQLDVDAAARHIGGDRDGAGLARTLDDVGLALVVLRVEHFVGDALTPEQLAQVLRHLDRDGADQDGLTGLVAVVDVVDHGGELLLLGLEDQIVLVVAGDRDVGRDGHDLEAVDLVELVGLGEGSRPER